ncbi:hypothetical protein DFS34DRAFT_218696 [Phlyctochytrium arcticum]|nr:hypothetical protein DFS34DRAFT_218696 [Phlyctochytrium arcticum]
MILRTSAGGCSRHSRRRILRILATAASFDESSLKVYFDTLIAVQDFEERENVYLGVLYIAPIIVNARGTAVSRIAMEQLIRYLSDDPTINKGHAPTDSLAAAAAMALIDVGNQCRNSALGLLADSALREHLNGSLSLQPYRGNLMRQRLNTFQDLKYCPYVSYIFQPISIGLAESYAENHSQMDALRQYLRTAERQHTEYGKMRYDDQSRELQFAKQSETIRLKIAPYHRNYREIQNVPSSPVNLAPSFMNGPPFTLAVPYPSSSGYASRRKLHHILPPRDRPSPEKSVKTACIRVELPTIAV